MTGRGLLVLCSFWLLAACAGRSGCPACTTLEHDYPCDAGVVDFGPPQQGIDMLFLSGGGSFGAYGAGVLYGWSAVQAGDHVRPTFEVVTGISTGALQATHVFLGTGFDSYLYRNYTAPGPELMPPRPWWQLLFASSVNLTTGLEQVLEDTVTDAMIDTVGTQHGERLLCVGTTNLDSGEFVSWDLTKMAAEGRYALYRDALLASASVPAASPPVTIGGSLHGDGGVRHQIFAVPLVNQIRGRRGGAADRAYFLVNDQLSVRAECTRERILPLAERAIRILMSEGLNSALLEAEIAVSSCDQGGNQMKTYFLYIPDDYALGFTSDDFDKEAMCRLFCRGRFDGMSSAWSGCRPSGVAPRPCADPVYPPGDGPDDSHCPIAGPSCPSDEVYTPIPACASPTQVCP